MRCRNSFKMKSFRIIISILCTITFLYIHIECCRFGSDRNCAFECRCKDPDEVCNPETGVCKSGCAETLPPGYGWGGPGCRIGNIAFNRTAEQATKGHAYYLRNAVLDGDTNGYWNLEDIWGPQTCSYPRYRWMVDLGVVSVVHNITIYNRLDSCCEERIRHFGIKIDLTSNSSNQQHCYTNDGSVKDVYEFPCDDGFMTGRYVQMYLNLTDEIAMNFCEFVVMGHPKIDCSVCNTTCNEVTGCESCGPGLMLPDCKTSCPDGYFGTNCMNECSQHCANNDVCDQLSGNCPSGCKKWWVPGSLCNIFIGLELPPEGNTIGVVDVTFNYIRLRWNGVRSIPQGYEHHYQYTVYRKSDNNQDYTVTVPHSNTTAGYMTYTLTDLPWNTNYTIWITPYRVWKTEREAGKSIGVTTKTKCAVPEPPTMDIQDHGEKFVLKPQSLKDFASRCDRIRTYYLSYECRTDGGFISSETNISVLNERHHSIYYGRTLLICKAWLDVENNEGFSSRSLYSFSNIDTTTYEAPTNIPNAANMITTESSVRDIKTPSESLAEDGDKKLGVIIGGSVGGVSGVLICVVIVVTCVVIKRRKETSQSSTENMDIPKLQSGQNENAGTDNAYDNINTETNIGSHHDESDGYQALDLVTGTQ